jgi:hypothetical protein
MTIRNKLALLIPAFAALGLCGVVARQIVDLATFRSALVHHAAAIDPSIASQEPPSFSIPDLSALAQTRTRPVFAASRRPAPPPEATPPPAPLPAAVPPAPPPAPPLTGRIVLLGIAHGPERKTALIRSIGANGILFLAGGEAIDGWTLSEILPDRLIFRAGDRRQELLLRPNAPAAPASPHGRSDGIQALARGDK